MNNINIYENMYSKKDGIIELKYKDFIIKDNSVSIKNKHFKENKSIIIFYAPWCSHCKNMYDSILELSHTNLHKFQIGVVNISDIKSKNELISNALEIKSIPKAFYISKNNNLEMFTQPVNYDSLFYYINMNLD